jgi:hypothetical protein
MVKLAVDRPQAGLDITQALAVRQLRKCQTKELIKARKSSEFIVSGVTLNAFMELVGRKMVDQLREDDTAKMHASACAILQPRSQPALATLFASVEIEIEKSPNTLHVADQQ